MVGEITSNENFVNIQMITSGKPFINHSGFCSVRIRTSFFRECSQLAGMHLCIDQHKVIKGYLFRSKPSTGTIFPTFKTVVPFNTHTHTHTYTPPFTIVSAVNIFVIKGILFESMFN